METKIKNYLLVFGLGIITLTSCNHSKEQDIVASNFAFAEQQLKYALTQIDEARANESQESREKRESKGWGELTNPRSIKPDGSLELVVSKDWTSGFFPGELGIYMSTRTIHIGKSRRRNIQKFWNAKKITERHTTWASRCIAAIETVIV